MHQPILKRVRGNRKHQGRIAVPDRDIQKPIEQQPSGPKTATTNPMSQPYHDLENKPTDLKGRRALRRQQD